MSPGARFVQIGVESALDLVMKILWPGFLGGGKRKFQGLFVKSDKGQLGEIGKWMAEGRSGQ